MRIYLEIPEETDAAFRARVEYAFRLFCAIYGHQPLLIPCEAATCDLSIRYAAPSSVASSADRRTLWLSRGYRTRSCRQPAPPPLKYASAGVSTLLHYAPVGEQAPDWLGEIFEWVSCADEYSVVERDSIGRPLFSATYAGRHHIDVQIPYAAVAMQCLQKAIQSVVPLAGLQPLHLAGAPEHLVVPTHDVDYFPVGRMHAIHRLVRNAIISCVLGNRPVLGMQQGLLAIGMVMGGSDPLDRLVILTEKERRRGICATYNFLVRHGHRQDASYTLKHRGVVEVMRWLELQGMEVGVHGSYACLDELGGMEFEVTSLNARGFHPRGGRQHWLRYTLDRLIPALESAGLEYDTSIGWSERTGFRAGACFAFPPYDFNKERAASFLEIPLVVMDQALRTRRASTEQMFVNAARILATSRSLGWGGISLLWHPAAFGCGWLPPEVGEVFWRLADSRNNWGDRWMRAADFVDAARQRFVEVGLPLAEKPVHALQSSLHKAVGTLAVTEPKGVCGSRIEPPKNFVGA
jgi:hypothetical protein